MDLMRERLRARGHHRAQVAAAMIGSAVIGGAISASASKSAANTQAQAANNATDAQQAMFNQTVALQDPFRQAGLDATTKLSGLLGTDPSQQGNSDYGSLLTPFSTSNFQLDPGVQFQLQTGQQALQNSQAAQDGSLSGAALKGLMSFNQNLAGTGYQSAYDRYMQNQNLTLDSLMGMANIGQAAASNTASTAPAFSSGIASTIQGAGNASAAGTVGASNAVTGAMTNGSNAYMLQNLLSQNSGTNSYSQFTNSPMASTIYSNGSLGD